MTDQEKFLESLRGVATALRHAADRIDQHAEIRTNATDLKPDFADAAAEVINDVTNAVFNLRLRDLVTTAARLDREVRRG